MAHKRALSRREAEHPGFRDIAAQPALRKVGACGAGLRAFATHELHMEELRSLRAHGAQPCYCALPHTRSAFRLIIGNVDMGALCQVAHRFGKRQVLGFHDEGEHVAAFPAAEAMPQLQGGVYLARRGFLVMKRAAQPEIATALLDRTRLAHDGHQVAGLANLLDILIADRHGCDRTPALCPCSRFRPRKGVPVAFLGKVYRIEPMFPYVQRVRYNKPVTSQHAERKRRERTRIPAT